MKKISKEGFTLVEVIMVVVLLGMLAGIGMPKYKKAVEKANQRLAQTNLILMYNAETLYERRNGSYWPEIGGWKNGPDIQTQLLDNTIGLDDKFTYRCRKVGGSIQYVCTATRVDNSYILSILGRALDVNCWPSSTCPDPDPTP